MSLKSKNRHKIIQNIQRRHFVAQAQRVGYSELEANQLIEQLIGKVDSVITDVANLLPSHFPQNISDSIFSIMKKQCKSLS